MSMSQVDMETILKFYMSKLSEQELAELDEALANGVPPEAMASDAAIKRRQWLDIGARARIAGRKQRLDRLNPAKDSATAAAFPHMNRLG
jgi:hypothetical protein